MAPNAIELARRGAGVAKGLRWLARNQVTLEESRRVVAHEVSQRPQRFLEALDQLVWPFPQGPLHQLLAHAGVEAGDVAALVDEHGLEGALGHLRDAGVYVAYEEYQGRVEARRGSASFSFGPADFFNPVIKGDYMATTGGTSGTGTPVELSFAWQRRQGRQRPLQHEAAGVRGAPHAVWLPVFPSAAGFGAVMKNMAGGATPERWFSQVPTDLEGISRHKQAANRFLPALSALARAGLPSPEFVPSHDPEVVVSWMREAVRREGRAMITGYASSLTSAARWAIEHHVDLAGVVGYPASEPVTAGKLAVMRASGMRPYPQYAFVPEGTTAIHCDDCSDEEYHLWEQDLAVVQRRRPRGDGTEVDAFLWTSLAAEAPRVLLNVENDDYGHLEHGRPCGCPLGELGLTTRVAHIRGISKVVTAGISLDGELFDRLAEQVLPARLGGGPGDFQFVEQESGAGTVVVLRVHPDLGAVDPDAAAAAVREALTGTDNGALAGSVWGATGVPVVREAPLVSAGGKTLSFDRLRTAPGPTVPGPAPDSSEGNTP